MPLAIESSWVTTFTAGLHQRRRSACLAPARNGQPSGGSVGAILGPCIEGNRRAWRGLVNSVNHSLEYCEAPRREADAGSDYNTIISLRSQLTLHRWTSGLIRRDKANVSLPATFRELLHRRRNASANLLSGRTRRQSRVGEIHRFWIVADQQNGCHEPALLICVSLRPSRQRISHSQPRSDCQKGYYQRAYFDDETCRLEQL